ncbi:LOW QUALITY PROTEIN: hypothetical protein RJ639_016527 [Escallonia herrerae]|uniref:Pectinesterase n=1 Tax=Escallonia herrerae TaxID=1293975 RepID=A0AA88VB24_9ASTE|nr:LOW QUALITY PROTEIN: hypothetical protein RJ639_016527 [Escallonia herrerae]
MANTAIEAVILTIIFFIPIVISDDNAQVPPQRSQVDDWFRTNIMAYMARKGTLDPALVEAEAATKVIKVRADGTADFKTVTDAINSIPKGNKKRVIVSIGEAETTLRKSGLFEISRLLRFTERLMICQGWFTTYGTVDSATLIVESDYFSAVNVVFANSALRPDGKKQGAQALALLVTGDKAALYNCKNDWDTLCDDRGRHFYKDCYIEGTVDFIFGFAKSIFLFSKNGDLNLFYAEYNCNGPGSDVSRRVGFAKKLSDADAKPFLSLSFVEGSKWLLPPASL